MKKILVVEEDNLVRQSIVMVINRILSGEVSMTFIGRGDQALEIIPTLKPDVVILDKGMQNVDGFSVLRSVRALPDYKGRIKILMISGDPSFRDEAMDLGADCFLDKPFSVVNFINALNDLLS